MFILNGVLLGKKDELKVFALNKQLIFFFNRSLPSGSNVTFFTIIRFWSFSSGSFFQRFSNFFYLSFWIHDKIDNLSFLNPLHFYCLKSSIGRNILDDDLVGVDMLLKFDGYEFLWPVCYWLKYYFFVHLKEELCVDPYRFKVLIDFFFVFLLSLFIWCGLVKYMIPFSSWSVSSSILCSHPESYPSPYLFLNWLTLVFIRFLYSSL